MALYARLRSMEIDLDKIDETVLGLLWLTLHDERRAWKGQDWGGLIENPVNKAKSVVLTDEGLRRAKELFHHPFRYGGLKPPPPACRTQ